MSTPNIVKSFDTVCDALRDVHDEASLWKLSDELVKIAPQGVQAVEKVVEQAKVRGIPTKSTNTLRLYRDVAIRFPAAERVPLVTFSAHREALGIGDAKAAKKLLDDLAEKHGPAGVTVTTVKAAIGAATGKVAAVKPTSTTSGKAATMADVALDLSRGGKAFLAELPAILAGGKVTLDSLHTGLSAVLADVENRRSKAARKAAASKVKPSGSPVGPKNSPAARKAVAAARNMGKGKPVAAGARRGGKAGDLRDL